MPTRFFLTISPFALILLTTVLADVDSVTAGIYVCRENYAYFGKQFTWPGDEQVCNNNNKVPNSGGGGDKCDYYDGDKGKCRTWSDPQFCPNDNSRKKYTYASMYTFNSTHFEYKMWSSYTCRQSTGRYNNPATCSGSFPLSRDAVIPLKTCMPNKKVTREDEPLNLCRKFTDSRSISTIDTCAAYDTIYDASLTPNGLSKCTKKTFDELQAAGCKPMNWYRTSDGGTPWMYKGTSQVPLYTCPIKKTSNYKGPASDFLNNCAAARCGCYTAYMNYLKKPSLSNASFSVNLTLH